MKILYYTWTENSKEDMLETLQTLGYEVVVCDTPVHDYEEDIAFTRQLESLIHETKCDIIFSFDFFPLIAKTAAKLRMKYVSWIYDSPHLTLYSPAAESEYNYIFLFDRIQYMELSTRKIPHLFHFPLAVNTTRLNRQLGKLGEDSQIPDQSGKSGPDIDGNVGVSLAECRDEISFVGSLYDKNMYDRISYLPEYLKGYLDGLMAAQSKIYGYNFIRELLTDDIEAEMSKYVKLNFDPSYRLRDRVIFSDMVNAKLTSTERVTMLEQIAKRHPLTLYSNSDPSLVPDAKSGGIVTYREQMPEVFRYSKINVNITLRSIESGMPLRALDVMGAGGFLLSNYQTELAENFVDGEELVLFESTEDLLEKVNYYLKHDGERRRIAYNGWKKTCEEYSYEKRVAMMLDLAEI